MSSVAAAELPIGGRRSPSLTCQSRLFKRFVFCDRKAFVDIVVPANRSRPSSTLCVRKSSRRFGRAVKSFNPRRSASFTTSFRLPSRARRTRSSTAATSSSNQCGPHASRHQRLVFTFVLLFLFLECLTELKAHLKRLGPSSLRAHLGKLRV
jgi:hypothetical protein